MNVCKDCKASLICLGRHKDCKFFIACECGQRYLYTTANRTSSTMMYFHLRGLSHELFGKRIFAIPKDCPHENIEMIPDCKECRE